VGRSSAAIKCNSVDFPLPDDPVIATNSPLATVRSRPSTARTVSPSNERTRFSTTTAGAPLVSCMADRLERDEQRGWGRRVDGAEQHGRGRDDERAHEDAAAVPGIEQPDLVGQALEDARDAEGQPDTHCHADDPDANGFTRHE